MFKRFNVRQKRASKSLQILGVEAPKPFGHNRVQFVEDEIHLLLFHETQQAINEKKRLEYIKQV